ncbi:MAG: serpin family protein [Ruminococcus sp.]
MKSIKAKVISAVSLALAAAVLGGCAGAGISKEEDLQREYKRSDTVAVYDFGSADTLSPEEYDKYTEGVTDFSLKLFAESVEDGENTVISTYSALSSLSLLANGSSGKTLSQFKNVLLRGGDITLLNEGNNYLSQRLQYLSGEEGKFTAVNSLWLDEGFDVRASFLQSAVNFYDAGVFRTELQSNETVDKINGWISENTEGSIDKVVDRISDSAVAVAVNTALLEDGWLTPYTESQIDQGTFHGTDGDSEVSFMHSEEFYLEESFGTGMVKSLKNTPLKFTAILPNEGESVENLAQKLTYSRLKAMIDSQNPLNSCKAYLPEFKIDSCIELSESLAELGLDKAFSQEEASFAGLSNRGDVYLSSVRQSAFIEVSPAGVKAGAAQIIEGNTSAKPSELKELRFDRPFVFVIYDNESGIPVFMGAVNNI